MSGTPALVFIPGGWHKPSCYEKVIKILQDEYKIKCVSVTLPSTKDNPNATFKDDIDAAHDAITSETTQGRDVIVIAHSYGGMVGNSVIKGLARSKAPSTSASQSSGHGYVTGLILIASGFTFTGVAFMDPFLGNPPPSWRVDKDTGYATLVANPREFFYHDVPDDEAKYWVDQLQTQSLKALFEGGEHAYAGWQDVPSWYIGTIEDVGLPVMLQRMTVSMARGQGAEVHHTELQSSHSPFLSMPEEVAEIIMEAVKTFSQTDVVIEGVSKADKIVSGRVYKSPGVKLSSPSTWLKFGIPLILGRLMGWGFSGFMGLRRLVRRR